MLTPIPVNMGDLTPAEVRRVEALAPAVWGPKWLAFLNARGMTPEQAEALPRPTRIALNADFLCRENPDA